MKQRLSISTSRFARSLVVICVLLGALSEISWLAYPSLLVLLCYFPGRFVIRLLRLRHHWDAPGRIILSASASLCLTPIILNILLSLHASQMVLMVVFGVIALLNAMLCEPPAVDSKDPLNRFAFDSLWARRLLLVVTIVILVATIVPYWPYDFNGRVVPSAIPDYVKHHSVLLSIEHNTLPLVSPFFASCDPSPAYYYHFFYLIPGTARMIATDVSIELAFGLQSALVGLCLLGLVYILTTHLFGPVSALMAVMVVSLVGGLDVIPLAIKGLAVITIDCWSGHTLRIHSLLHQMMWTPQNVQGVLILLFGVYLISSMQFSRKWLIVAPLLAWSLMGASIWIALPAFAGAVVFLIDCMIRQRKTGAITASTLAVLLGCIVLTVLVLAPIAFEYREMSQRIDGGLTLSWPRHKHALLGLLVRPGLFAHLLDIPLMLVVELGASIILPLVAPRSVWRQAWRNPGTVFLICAASMSLILTSLVRSDFTYNDLGSKGIMIAQLCGAIIGCGIIAKRGGRVGTLSLWHNIPISHAAKIIAVTSICLGLATSLWEAPLTAIRRFADPEGALEAIAPRGALRWKKESGAYRYLRYELPDDAIILAYPSSERVRLSQIANRPIATTLIERDTRVLMPSNIAMCEAQRTRWEHLMNGPCNAQAVYDTLTEWGVPHVFVGDIEEQDWACANVFDNKNLFDHVYADENVVIVQPVIEKNHPHP